MSADSKIEWTDHTFNPWWGCSKVSPACKNCYAEAFARRVGQSVWGDGAARRLFGDKHWAEPVKWNAAAAKEGVRRRVFCASMADVFEARPELDEQRARLWSLIEETPSLDWLLLTKRPENIREMVPGTWLATARPNVWFGATVENREEALRRIPLLLDVPAVVRFLSCEPLLEAIGLRPWLMERKIHWVIVGGESGHHARPFEIKWARDIVDACACAVVACFVKQLGAEPMLEAFEAAALGTIRDRKGGDMEEWPQDIRIRQFPGART